MAKPPIVTFDRRISGELEHALSSEGPLHWLVERSAQNTDGLFDLQLRADPKSNANWISIYVGLTDILRISESNGAFTLRAHTTHQEKGHDHLDLSQVVAVGVDALATMQEGLHGYVDLLAGPGGVALTHTENEGRIQGLLCAGGTTPTRGFQREAAMSFRSAPIKSALINPFRARILEATADGCSTPPPWWPGVRNRGATPRLGLEIDVLGVDEDGRLLVVEVKPPGALEGITWSPAQVRLYAESVALWLEIDPHARSIIVEMVAQRARIGLPAPIIGLPPAPDLRVVPVVAIGEGKMSEKALPRLSAVASAIDAAPATSSRIEPLELWIVAGNGSITEMAQPWDAS